MQSIAEDLIRKLRSAGRFNPQVQVPPCCILWPDRDRQWESALPRLLAEIPELLALGDFDPQKRTGPAIWLRCVIAHQDPQVNLPPDRIPVLYLPSVGRQDLRVVENAPEPLKPLVELQFRGAFWSQANAKDWTILACLKSDQGGLGLDVAQDTETKNALLLALPYVLDEEVGLLEGKRLDADFFHTLLTGGDPTRNLLNWIDHSESFRSSRGEGEWKAFVGVCKSQLGFNPEKEGPLAAAAKMAAHEGPWQAVWDRFCEAPRRYPNIPEILRKCSMPAVDLLSDTDSHGSWPQWNERQEADLRSQLLSLDQIPAGKASELILDLEKRHRVRRRLVWAELGESPLAVALEHLAVLAERTSQSLAAGTIEDLATGYLRSGHLADQAVLDTLAGAAGPGDQQALITAIRAVYLPWAEDSARHLQQVVSESSYPGERAQAGGPGKSVQASGECVAFVDGLRLDLARRLVDLLSEAGCGVVEKVKWAALPTVTATGKPAVTPVAYQLCGEETSAEFEPLVAEIRQPLTGYRLKKLLDESGWSPLDPPYPAPSTANGWCELGSIDHEGHERGWKLSRQVESLMQEISAQVLQLLAAGWKNVRIVTDHGWLLLPGGLPKVDLPSDLVENKWGRCAAIKPGAVTDARLYPWHWNPLQHFALAEGISCFKKGQEYAHGGLSLQECLTLELQVTAGKALSTAMRFREVTWRGLRCSVAVDGEAEGLVLDLRRQAGDPDSSLVLHRKTIDADGTASVVVEGEDMDGRKASIVLLGPDGELVLQRDCRIGGGSEG